MLDFRGITVTFTAERRPAVALPSPLTQLLPIVISEEEVAASCDHLTQF